MRIFISLALVWMIGCQAPSTNTTNTTNTTKFTITIQYNCLMVGFCPEVTITSDSLSCKDQSGQNKTLKKALSRSQAQHFEQLFRSLNDPQVKTDYINHQVDDGISLSIETKASEKLKTIQISNYYLPQAHQLIKAVNELLPAPKKLYYPEKMISKTT